MDIFEIKAELAKKILTMNIQSGMTGKFECWFKDGRVLDIRNTQNIGDGFSTIDIANIKLYTVADK